MIDSRPTVIKIKLKNLINNLKKVRLLLDNSSEIIAVIKANAYGHGSVEIARCLSENGVSFFGVACAFEAEKVFNAEINGKILSLGKIYREDIELTEKFPYILTVSGIEDLKALANSGKKVKIHLKFDTGMGRCGFFFEKLKYIVDFLKNNKNIDVDGVLTHFPEADKNKEFTENQIKTLVKIKEIFLEKGFKGIKYHCANSDGIINFSSSFFDYVRPGLILYGSYWNREIKKKLKLKPVMEFISKIVDIKNFKRGDSIGYGRTYIVKKDFIKGALIPVGYADGFPRALSNKGYVLINNKKCNIIGRISMDWLVADVTEVENVQIGSDVILFGDDELKADIDEIASLADTISYEILCNVGQNYRKEFIYDCNS